MKLSVRRVGLFALAVLAACLFHVLAADYDGDRIDDAAVYYPTLGFWYVQASFDELLMGGTPYQFGFDQGLPLPGDFDGDGLDDVIIYWPDAPGGWYWNQSNHPHGYGYGFTEPFRAIHTQSWGWSEGVPVPADYDGDGKTDIAVYHPLTGLWYILSSATGQMFGGAPIQFGFSEGVPVPADYDGDGADDIGVYWPAGGEWYLFLSNATTGYDPTNRLFQAIPWGWSTVLPAPADYEGDGKADVTVYDPDTATWYIRKSSDGLLYSGAPIVFGFDGTLPVPGDYDGDRVNDIVVYWPEGGTWFCNNSNFGYSYAYNATNRLIKSFQWGWSEAVPISLQYQINKWFDLIP